MVEKQKSVNANQDPVIETTEVKARAKVLETRLHKLSGTVTTTTSSTNATPGVDDGDKTMEDSVESDSEILDGRRVDTCSWIRQELSWTVRNYN